MGGAQGTVGMTRNPCADRERAEGEGQGWLSGAASHAGPVASVGMCHVPARRPGKSVPTDIKLLSAGATDGAIYQWVFRPSFTVARTRAARIIQANYPPPAEPTEDPKP